MLLVRRGDADLDKTLGGIIALGVCVGGGAAVLTFVKHVLIDGAEAIAAEAMAKGVGQLFDAEVLRATLVGAVQERAMLTGCWHALRSAKN